MNDLGVELLQRVFSYLDDSELRRASLSSQLFLTAIDALERWDSLADSIVEMSVFGKRPPIETARELDVAGESPLSRLNEVVATLKRLTMEEDVRRRIAFRLTPSESKKALAWRSRSEKALEARLQKMCMKWDTLEELTKVDSYEVTFFPLPQGTLLEMKNIVASTRLGVADTLRMWLKNKGSETLVIEGADFDRLAQWGRQVTALSNPWKRWDVTAIRNGDFRVRVTALGTKAQKVSVDHMGETFHI